MATTALPLEREESPASRRNANRLSTENLLHFAEYLPPLPRAILNAHLHRGMDTQELALLHHVTPRQMRRRIERLRSALADPCFLLAAQYASLLPEPLAGVATDFWIEGQTLRELALRHHKTLHQIRTCMTVARSLLLIHASRKHPISHAQACKVLRMRLQKN